MNNYSKLTEREIAQNIAKVEYERLDKLDRAVEEYISGLEVKDMIKLLRDYIRDDWDDDFVDTDDWID